MSLSYKSIIKIPLNKIKLKNFNYKFFNYFKFYPYYIIYNYNINYENISTINSTNPLNKFKIFTITKYYKIEKNTFPFLSYISDFCSYEYKNILPTFIILSDNSIYMTDLHNIKLLHFNKFLEIKKNPLIPYILYKNTSLKILHKQFINLDQKFNFNLQYIYSSSPKKIQLINHLINFYVLKSFVKNTNLNYKLPYNNGLLNKLFYIYKYPKKALDITFGLQAIESIFESRSNNESTYLISKNTCILNTNLNQFYNITTKQFITHSFIEFIDSKNLNWIYTITNKPIYNLEQASSIIYGGQILTTGTYFPSNIINSFYNSKLFTDKQYNSAKQSLFFAMNLILESLLNQYLYQGISLPSIHFELMAKKMTSCVKINFSGDLTLISENIFPLTLVEILNLASKTKGFRMCTYTPIILGITKSTLANSGFLSNISFQETLKLLGEAVLQQSVDWLSDLKSKIIATDLIPSGTGWWRYFNKL